MNENLNTSMENAIGEQSFTPKAKNVKKEYSKIDIIYALVFYVVGILFVQMVFYSYDVRFLIGGYFMNIPLFTLAYIAAVMSYAHYKEVKMPRESLFWLGVMLCLALPMPFYSFFGGLQIFALIAVAAYWTAGLGNRLLDGESSAWVLTDGVNSLIGLPFANFFGIFSALKSTFTGRNKSDKKSNAKKLFGVVLCCGLIAFALYIIMPLLFKADENFAILIQNIMPVFSSKNKFEIFKNIINIILYTLVALYLYSLSYCSFNRKGIYVLEKSDMQKTRDSARFAPDFSLKIMLYVVCAVYSLFIILQASYLFSAFAGRLYGQMTYAQYAKNGFFELCRIGIINLAILAVCSFLSRDNTNKNIKAPSVVLCVISLLLISAAAAKLVMYISAYGLTPKRVAGCVLLIWLCIVFVCVIIRFFKAFNLAKTAILSGAVAFCLLCVLNINQLTLNFNLKYNYEENQHNSYETLDDYTF